MREQARYIRWFDEITINRRPLGGGENATLGKRERQANHDHPRTCCAYRLEGDLVTIPVTNNGGIYQ